MYTNSNYREDHNYSNSTDFCRGLRVFKSFYGIFRIIESVHHPDDNISSCYRHKYSPENNEGISVHKPREVR